MEAVVLPTASVQPVVNPFFDKSVEQNIGQNVEAATKIESVESSIEQVATATTIVESVESTLVSQEILVNQEHMLDIQNEVLPVEEAVIAVASEVEQLEAPALFVVDPIPSPVTVEKKVSALSLSSIRARKEMESSLEKKVVNPDDLPKEPFTAEQFMEEWSKYADKLARSGFMLMSSLMGMVPPVIHGTSVSLEMPNEGSKLSFDENKFDLVNYLRKKLSNYDLEIEIKVNEEVKIQKRVLDKDDKLVRFIELNPAMQYMKEIFDLEFK
ncbi:MULTISPECIES: hypothetical protein [unclassified Myroides]|uniref:hypothetical protein n=1 Tax=unclassified Myroides TaxID=2642485 RepID=UPI002577642E|nr:MULTISPECIES: hypothetical protein [unclassified Myroides]